MSTAIIGCLGSMGTRYRAILNHLEESFVCLDKNDSLADIVHNARFSDRIILCTPTPTHFSLLKRLLPLHIPILCEKPLSTDMKEMEGILKLVELNKTPFTMMLQYSELVRPRSVGHSFYNYFRSGHDGLIWDCMQIIGLANGEVEINNNSPIWKCMINGEALSLSDMDGAYVTFVEKWMSGQITQTPEFLYNIHEKTSRLNDERISRFN